MDKVEQGIVEVSFEMTLGNHLYRDELRADKIELGVVEESFETRTKRFAVISRVSFTSRHGLYDTRMDNGILVSLSPLGSPGKRNYTGIVRALCWPADEQQTGECFCRG